MDYNLVLMVVIGVLLAVLSYYVYTSVSDLTDRQDNLEQNIRSVMNTINDHYFSLEGHPEEAEEVEEVTGGTLTIGIPESDGNCGCDSDCGSDCECESDCNCNTKNTQPDINDDRILHLGKEGLCGFIPSKGKNIGKVCGNRASRDGHCTVHLKYIPVPQFMNPETVLPSIPEEHSDHPDEEVVLV